MPIRQRLAGPMMFKVFLLAQFAPTSPLSPAPRRRGWGLLADNEAALAKVSHRCASR